MYILLAIRWENYALSSVGYRPVSELVELPVYAQHVHLPGATLPTAENLHQIVVLPRILISNPLSQLHRIV